MSKKRKYGNAWKDVKADDSQVAQMDAIFDRFVAPANSTETDLKQPKPIPESPATGSPAAGGSNHLEAGYVSLDSTHTASEQRIYSVMYRETITKKVSDRHFRVAELMEATGIKSDKTVRMAITGLVKKLSITIVKTSVGDNYGQRYKVFTPKEIFDMRRSADIKIDLQTKRILPPVEPSVEPSVTPPVDPPVDFTGGPRYFLPGGPPVSSLDRSTSGRSLNHVLNHEDHDDDRAHMRVQQSSLINSFGEQNSELHTALQSAIPGATDKEIDRAISDLMLLDAGQIEEWAAKATTPPVSPQYFVECKRRLYAATERSKVTNDKSNKEKTSRNTFKPKIEALAKQIRSLHVGDGKYGLADFSEDLKRACAREGLPYDSKLINEIINR
jgi:hypothetical protein